MNDKVKQVDKLLRRMRKIGGELIQKDYNLMGEEETAEYFRFLVDEYEKRDFEKEQLVPCFMEDDEAIDICLDMAKSVKGAICSALKIGYELGRAQGYYEGLYHSMSVLKDVFPLSGGNDESTQS